MAVIVGAACLTLAFVFPPPDDLDGAFSYLKTGMSPARVEAILGPPNGQGNDNKKIIELEFNAMDGLPWNVVPPHLVRRDWWHDDKDRFLYVDYYRGGVLRTKLFTPAGERSTGPDPAILNR